jgi:glycosyltransferase involved in cell wall biosynthesis
MRVLLVTTWYPTVTAPGSGIFVRKDAELLSTAHDVHVVHLASPALLSEADATADAAAPLRVTRIPMSTADPRAWRRARSALDAHLAEADVLHTQAFSALLPFAGARPALPWVHTEHWSGVSRPESVSPLWRVIGRFLRPLLRRPDVVTAVCEYLAVPIRRARPHDVLTVPCIVEPPERIVLQPDGRELRLVSVGGLVDGKDPLLAVETVAELVARGRDAHLTWVGDGPLRDAVRARAEELGVGDRVVLAGTLPPSGVAAVLDDADVFVLPTRGENFCVSAAEAIVHGRPAVVGAIGGQGEYITSSNGRLVVERTSHAYADAILSLPETDPTEVAATIGDRFSAARVLAGYDRAYARAVEARRAR